MKVIYKLLVMAACAFAAVFAANRAQGQTPDVIGLWNFDSSNLVATAGNNLEYIGDTASRTAFGTTTSFGLPAINGTNAVVIQVPTNATGQGYTIDLFGSQANGGGGFINQWTILFDVLYPTASANKVRALMQTDGGATPDSDLQIGAAGGLGSNGDFDGTIQANTWYRIGFVIDTVANTITKYIDGALVGTQSATFGATSVDGRWALMPGATAELFNDDNGETAVGYYNSIQLRNLALSPLQVRALGGASAAGIPEVIPPIPSFVQTWVPAGPYAYNVINVGAIIHDGDTDIADASIQLRLDGVLQTSPNITRDGDLITVTKGIAALPVASRHVVQINYTDSLNGAMVFSNQFEVAVFLEDFNELTLGPNMDEVVAGTMVWTKTAPAGWTHDDSGVPGVGDPANDGVTEWAGWSFADVTWWATAAENQRRAEFTKATGAAAIADPDEWDDQGHAAGLYSTWLSTPVISLAGAGPNTAIMKLDTSWRPECCDEAPLTNDQTFVIYLQYDSDPETVILHWSSNTGDPNYHPDDPNGTQVIKLNNPAGAAAMRLRFGCLYSANDWWVAFDNLQILATPPPPIITTQPQGDLVSAGATATLSVRATSELPLTYQWQFSNTNLPGATSSNLVLANVQAPNAGNYRAIVSSSSGSVTSAVATIRVFSGTITQDLVVHLTLDGDFNDSSGRGNNAAGGASGTPTFVPGKVGTQAMHIGSDPAYATLGTPADLNFGTSTDFSISFWTRVVAWVNGGTTDLDAAFISNKNWGSGGNPGYVLDTDSDGRMEWNLADPDRRRLDYDGPGGTFGNGGVGDNTWHHVVVTFDRSGNISTFVDAVKRDATPFGGGTYNLDTPAGLNTNIGQDGTGGYGPKFTDADFDDVGVWRRVLTPQEIASIYGQGLNGQDLTTATGNPPVVPPTITTQPQSRTVYAGFPTTFTVGASGTPPLNYQWRKNGTNITGQTGSSLVINNAQESDEGSYDVIVSNTANSVPSNPATLTVNPAPPALVTGQWDFDSSNLVATIGRDLEYFSPTIQADTSFGTTTSFGIPNIAGAPATVLYFSPSTASWGGYIMHHGADPNLGTYVNLYTIIYDVLYPPASDGQWRSFLQTSTANANDGDFFVNTANGIGISGNYQGSVSANVWHRIALVVNLSVPRVSKYLDGVNVGNQTLGEGIDGRWSLDPFALLFGDEDGDQHATYVNSVQFRNWVMTDAEIAALGTPTAGGIPAPLTITHVEASGGNLTLNFVGGNGPWTVQKKTNITDAAWTDVVTTSNKSVQLPASGASGFYRVVDRINFTVNLNGANERPTPIVTGGTGSGTVTLDGNTVTVNVTFLGLTSAANNAHIHGPATTEQSAGVLQGLTFTAATSGTVTGMATLSALNVQRVIDGLTYVNIHTVNNPGGEIRGQIVRVP